MDRDRLAERYARLRHLGVLVGLMIAVLGVYALAPWMLDVALLPQLVRARPNTALCFILLGGAIVVLGRSGMPSRAARWIAAFSGSIAVVIASVTLVEMLLSRNLGVDAWLARQAAIEAAGGEVRMLPAVAVTILLCGCAVALTAWGRSMRLAHALAAIATLPPLLAVIGHVYRVEPLYHLGAGPRFGVAPALVLVAGAAAIMLVRPDQGLMRRATSDRPASVMVRRMLPAVFLPMALGALAYAAEQAGWMGSGMASAVVTIGVVAGLVILLSTSSTTLERLETDRQRVEDDLRRAVHARDDFLSAASHELRTPMTTLLLHVDTLMRSARAGPLGRAQLLEKLENVRRQAKRLERLVDALLDVSRAAHGRLELSPEPIDISQVVARVVDRFALEARRSGSEIVFHAPEHVPGMWDEMRVDQVVSNLLSNAVKYGKGAPVAVDLEAEPSVVRLKVRDEGIGIAAEDRERIFQRFERAVSDQNYPGLGLGLWIVRQLVASMGGEVSVDTEPGHGATFTVELPRAA